MNWVWDAVPYIVTVLAFLTSARFQRIAKALQKDLNQMLYHHRQLAATQLQQVTQDGIETMIRVASGNMPDKKRVDGE